MTTPHAPRLPGLPGPPGLPVSLPEDQDARARADRLLGLALRSRNDVWVEALARAAGAPVVATALASALVAGESLPARMRELARAPFSAALATAWFGMARREAEQHAAVEVYRQVLEALGERGLRGVERRHYLQAAYLTARLDLVADGLERCRGVSADVLSGLRADLAHPQHGGGADGVDEQVYARWVELLGERFVAHDLRGPRVHQDARPLFDGLHADPVDAPGSVDGPLVTVAVPTYRPDRGLVTSVASLLDQTYGHVEVLLVDDASGPEHEEVLAECAALDERVRLLRQEVNGGAYLARNRAVELAAGAFVTTQDADDWSHPRRLELHVAALRERPEAPASRSAAIRMRPDLTRQWFGYRPERTNASSLLVRREVFDRVGLFDQIRKGADSEFAERLVAAGAGEIVDLHRPLAITRLTAGSLSRGDFTLGRHSPERVLLRSSFRDYHARLTRGEVVPPLRREGMSPYAVPLTYVRDLPGREAPPSAYPVVVLADLTQPPPTLPGAGGTPAVLAREDLGRAAASSPDHHSELLAAARRGDLTLLTDADEVHADVLVVTDPALLAPSPLPLPRLRADTVLVAAGPAGPHDRVRDLESAGAAARVLGSGPRWFATDPQEQEAWAREGWRLPLLDELLDLTAEGARATVLS